MKISLSYIIMLLTFGSCSKKNDAILVERFSVKSIEFNVCKEKDYSDTVYQNIQAQLSLAIYKVTYDSKNKIKIWDTTFSIRKIKDYPDSTQPIILQKSITGISDLKEYVLAVSSTTYYAEAQSAFSKSEPVALGNIVKKVQVRL